MSRRLVVVGGGLAGISAALEAADAGAEVVLVERRGHLGGLTWSFQRRGLSFDNGQHVFLRCCTAYLGFLDRIGAADQVTLQTRLDVPVVAPGGVTHSISRRALPAPLHLGQSLLTYGHLSLGQRVGLIPAALSLGRLSPDDPMLDDRSFGDWLSEHHQSPAAVERLWNLIALPTINVQASEASLALAVKVFREGLLDAADAGDIGWAAVPLGQLHGENATRALDRAGVEICTGATVTALELGPDGGHTAVLTDRRLQADGIVLATAPATAHELAPAAVPASVLGLGSSPIVNVHLVFDRRVTDLPFAAGVRSPVQFVFDRTQTSGLTGPGQVLSISLSGADDYLGRHTEDLVATFQAALGELFPAARRATVLDGTVSRERQATFRGVPGTAALRPGPLTSVPGLALAGAWCATGWPATMESAVRSGTAAAHGALAARPAADAELDPSASSAVPAREGAS